MIPRMSRPANPHDNASCESFVKTLKREVYATEYRDLEHQRANIEGFIDRYYDRSRLRSALGYQSPKEFERALPRRFVEATMSFSGMRRSIDPIEIVGEEGSRPIVSMSLRLAIPWRDALQQGPPLRQPSVSLTKESLFEENKPFNGRCSYRKLSHRRGPAPTSVVKIVAALRAQMPPNATTYRWSRAPAPKADSGPSLETPIF